MAAPSSSHLSLPGRRLLLSGARWLQRRIVDRRNPRDVWLLSGTRPGRRALLAYRMRPFAAWPLPPSRFTCRNHADRNTVLMVRALNAAGYVVDVVAFSNPSWLPRRDYALFIGHGGINFSRIAECLPGRATRIYFSSGIEWKEFNRREEARFQRIAAEKGVELPRDRRILHSEDAATSAADGIICLGNGRAARTYREHSLVIAINNTVRAASLERVTPKDFAQGRSRFLFFSGGGSVHKGLDLLLGAVQGSQYELHVCHRVDSDFARLFARELASRNVHVHGFVRERSKTFLELARTCNCVVTASCAEGQPGSVLECLAHGLVPVIPPEAHIDYVDFAVPLDTASVATVKRGLDAACALTPEECRRRSVRAVEEARTAYCEQSFERRFREAVETISRVSQAELGRAR